MKSLAVISAGLSQPSSTRLLADRLAAATLRQLDDEVDLHAFDLRDHAHDIVNNLVTGFPSPALKQVIDTILGADALIAVTPIFNASYSGLFKSFFDALDEGSLVDKPVLIAASGGSDRHSLALEHALRPMFVYLRTVVMPTSVFASSQDWAGDTTETLSGRIQRAAAELADQMRRAESAEPVDPFALTTPFEQLLAGE